MGLEVDGEVSIEVYYAIIFGSGGQVRRVMLHSHDPKERKKEAQQHCGPSEMLLRYETERLACRNMSGV